MRRQDQPYGFERPINLNHHFTLLSNVLLVELIFLDRMGWILTQSADMFKGFNHFVNLRPIIGPDILSQPVVEYLNCAFLLQYDFSITPFFFCFKWDIAAKKIPVHIVRQHLIKEMDELVIFL